MDNERMFASMTQKLKVLELFAGVGGFRVGLEHANKDLYQTCWSNQWEPSRKSQDAFEVYDYHYPDSENINEDITKISNEKFEQMDADIIVGVFLAKIIQLPVVKSMKWVLQVKKGFFFGKLFGQLTTLNQNILFWKMLTVY